MNLEEMQQAWKELDERVTRNEILHREEVKRILNTRRENSLERLTRLEKMGLAMALIVCIIFASAWIAGFHPLPGITGSAFKSGKNRLLYLPLHARQSERDGECQSRTQADRRSGIKRHLPLHSSRVGQLLKQI